MRGTVLAVISAFLFAAVSQRCAANAADTWTYDPQAPNAPCPSMPACGVWHHFRAAHPWPYQTFAAQEGRGETVVILSEPPPALSRNQLAQTLKALFGENLIDLSYDRWPTGLDGWLEDVVFRVRVTDQHRTEVLSGASFATWRAPTDVVDRLRLVYRLLHHTSDGFWLDHIAEDEPNLSPIAELKIPVSDLDGWLADDQRGWTSAVGQGGRKKTRDLYAEKVPGVFYHEGGIVALVAPRGVKLANLAADFRRFAVTSDLIVRPTGLKDGGLLLLGRSRQIALTTLPPLRFEASIYLDRRQGKTGRKAALKREK